MLILSDILLPNEEWSTKGNGICDHLYNLWASGQHIQVPGGYQNTAVASLYKECLVTTCRACKPGQLETERANISPGPYLDKQRVKIQTQPEKPNHVGELY